MKHRYSIKFFPLLKHSGITLAAFTLLIAMLAATASANTISITSSTNWSGINSGSGTSGQPGTSDAVIVSSGATLTVDVNNAVCASLTLGAGSTPGTLTFVNGGTLSLTVNGTIIVGSGTAGGTGTIHLLSIGKLTCGGLSLSSTSAASVYGDGGTLTLNGAITVGSGGTYSWYPTNGTVVVAATSALPSSVFTQFNNLTINPGSGNTVTTGADMSVNNNLVISSGTLADPSLPIHGNAVGTFTMAAGTNLTLGDPASPTVIQFPYNFTTAHIALDPTSTVTFQANGNQSVSDAPVYGNLVLSTGTSLSTKTIIGATTVAGTLSISPSTTFDVSSNNWGLNVGGNFTNNGTFTQESGMVTMIGTAAETIGGSAATTFNNLTIFNTAASVSAGANIAVNGTLTVNPNSTLDMKSYTLSVGTPSNSGTINTQSTSGSPISSGKTWGGIVNFNGSGVQYVPAGTYTTLKANNSSGSVNLAGPVALTTLVIGDQTSNSNFFDEGYQITTAQKLTIISGNYACESSTFPWANSTIGGTVSYNASGAQTVASETYTNLVLWGAATKTLAASGTIAVTGTLTVNSGTTLAFGTTAQTLALTGTGSGTLANSGTIDMTNAAHVLQVAGSNISFGTLITGTLSKVEYTSTSGGQSISSLTYNNLQLDNTSGTNTAGGDLTVNGALTLTNTGILDMGTNILSVVTAPTSGTINTQNTSSTPISAGMTWGCTINFNGSSSQTVPSGTYVNLQLNNASGATLTGNVNVTGTLTMASGDLTTTNTDSVSLGTNGNVSGEGSGHYVLGNLIMDEVIGSGAGSSRLNTLGVSISSGSDNLGTVEVIRVSGFAGQVTIGTSQGIYKKWSIISSNATTTGRNLTLTWVSDDVLYGCSLSSAQVWNSTNSGSSWSAVSTAGDLSSNTATIPFTSSSTPTIWTISSNAAATAQRNALLFGGAQYVVTTASSTLTATTMTVEAWIKPGSSPTGTEEILRLTSSSNDGCELQMNTSGIITFNSYSHNIGQWATAGGGAGSISCLDGNWHHIAAVTNSGGNTYLYVDGVLQSPTTNYGLDSYASNVLLYIGAHPGPSDYFSGQIAEARIWNVARTQSQIQSTMHTTLTGSESGLIGYWPLNGGTSTFTHDYTNGNDGTLQGFTFSGNGWVTSTAPVGAGTSTDIASFTSGTANLGTVSLTTTSPFSNSVNLVGTEITASPDSLPASSGTLLSDRYWIITPYGTPGTSYSTNLTFTVPSSFTKNGAESGSTYTLYHRGDNSDGSWTTAVSGAASVTSTTITFNGITSFSQFMIGSTDNALPVELVSFTANNPGDKVELLWKTATEVNNYGFEIQRLNPPLPSGLPLQGGNMGWVKIGFVKGSGNSNSPKNYSFIDVNPPNGTVEYRLKQIDNDGSFIYSSIVKASFTNPDNFALSQNYPNPFNPSTTIQYTIPKAEHVTIKVYDELGREVTTLLNENKEAGHYNVTFNASNLASGIYFYRISAGSFNDEKKLILLK